MVMWPLGIKDRSGVDLYLNDRCIMWRPDGLDIVVLTKYNEKTKIISVHMLKPVDELWHRRSFSTPYRPTKFYKL